MSHSPQHVENAIFLIVKFLTCASEQVKNTSIQVQKNYKKWQKITKKLVQNRGKNSFNNSITNAWARFDKFYFL